MSHLQPHQIAKSKGKLATSGKSIPVSTLPTVPNWEYSSWCDYGMFGTMGMSKANIKRNRARAKRKARSKA